MAFHEDMLIISDSSAFSVGFDRNTQISRYRTYCCALGQFGLGNNATKEKILSTIEKIKTEISNSHDRQGGERAFLVATLPEETQLEETLKECGFEYIYTIHRRNCYPEDSMLKLWIISW